MEPYLHFKITWRIKGQQPEKEQIRKQQSENKIKGNNGVSVYSYQFIHYEMLKYNHTATSSANYRPDFQQIVWLLTLLLI